jgi:hypothetical protein
MTVVLTQNEHNLTGTFFVLKTSLLFPQLAAVIAINSVVRFSTRWFYPIEFGATTAARFSVYELFCFSWLKFAGNDLPPRTDSPFYILKI